MVWLKAGQKSYILYVKIMWYTCVISDIIHKIMDKCDFMLYFYLILYEI